MTNVNERHVGGAGGTCRRFEMSLKRPRACMRSIQVSGILSWLVTSNLLRSLILNTDDNGAHDEAIY